MKQTVLFLIVGIALGTYIYALHPAMTLIAVGGVICIAAALVQRESIRIWLLLSLFTIVGALHSSREMQRFADAFHTEKRSSILYYNHQISQQSTNSLLPIRENIAQFYNTLKLKPENNAIVKAMTLGDKKDISKDIRRMYSRTGASHVLALSGMHLAIIYTILSLLILKLAMNIYFSVDELWERYAPNHFLKYLITHRIDAMTLQHVVTTIIIAMIWCYTVLVGMSPSVVRAATMLTIYAFTRLISRTCSVSNALAITAFIILIISPLTLFDVGFQMSFLAILGIATYLRPLQYAIYKKRLITIHRKNRIYKKKKRTPRWVKVPIFFIDCILLSFSAQLLVAPLVAYYFGVVSLSSLLTTALISITALLIIWTSFTLVAISLIGLTPLAVFLSPILDFIISLQHSILQWQASLPYSFIEGFKLSLPQLLLIYCIIICITKMVKILKKYY